MKSFKQFITEKYLESGRAPYYHSTDLDSAFDILKDNAIGKYTYNHPEYNPSTHPQGKLVKGPFSVSRDPTHWKSKDVKFELDADKIHQKYKVEPYADPFVATDNTGDTLVSSYGRRWESESKIHGPLKNLDEHLRAIHITKNAHEQIKRGIEGQQKSIEQGRKNLELLPQGKWIPDRNNSKFIDENTPINIPPKMDVQKRIENIHRGIQNSEKYKKQYEDFLNHPKLKIGTFE